ncbi:hypothetical protein MXD58_028415, partial [Frankia sp. AgKG'84/4]|nr:hypothetical protein [Frankia sp. AgKG'84/4]
MSVLPTSRTRPERALARVTPTPSAIPEQSDRAALAGRTRGSRRAGDAGHSPGPTTGPAPDASTAASTATSTDDAAGAAANPLASTSDANADQESAAAPGDPAEAVTPPVSRRARTARRPATRISAGATGPRAPHRVGQHVRVPKTAELVAAHLRRQIVR